MTTMTINVYQYSELSEKAKEKAREWWIDRMTVEEWSDFVLEDAGNIGLKITGFDIYRNDIEGKLEMPGDRVAAEIIAEHGESCDTYGAAQKYLAAREKLEAEAEKDEYGDIMDTSRLEDLDDDFRKELLECYLVTLRNEYEYHTGEEYIAETMEANEYTFTSDGKRFD